MKDLKNKKVSAQKWRSCIQFFFFILVAFIATTNGLKEKGIVIPLVGEASLHAVCPFGGVVSFWQLFTKGTLVKKIHDSSVILSVIGIALALFFGPVICGWICPFGTFQEWIAKIGKKIWGKRYNTFVPAVVDRPLRFLRYVVLIRVSYLTVISGVLVFQNVDPFYTLFNFWRKEITLLGFIVFGVILILSLFIERPFCKYMCPYGAFQGILNLVRVFSIKRNTKTCINCNACNRACPMNIDVAHSVTVSDHQCISCLACTSESACPVSDTVVLAFGKEGVK